MELDDAIVEYIGMTQPALEKYASNEEQFLEALQIKLASCVKQKSMTKDEADAIMKQASASPASVFQHLDVPNFSSYMGTLSTKQASDNSSEGDEKDALYKFAFDLD